MPQRRKKVRDLAPSRLIDEVKWRTLAQNVPDFLALVDRQGRFLWLNRVVKGLDLAAVSNQTIYDFMSRRDQAKARAALKAVFATGKLQRYDVDSVGDNGKRAWYTTRISAIKAGRRVTAAILIATDITPRRRAEERLLAAEERLRILLSRIPAVVWTTDTDLRWTSSHGAGLAALRLEPDEAVGKTFYEFFGTRDRKYPPIAAALRALRGEANQYEQIWQDHIYQSHVEPLHDARGTIIGTIGIAIDVTETMRSHQERDRLEAALRQMQKVDAMGRLATGAAHGFGNALTAIRGFIDAAQRKLPENHVAHADLRSARAAAEHAAQQASSLLFLGHGNDPTGSSDCPALLRESIDMLSRMLPSNIKLKLDIPSDLQVWVNVNPTQLQQVIMNLAINARDAMPAGGELTITLTQIPTSEGDLRSQRFISLTVADTGEGMSSRVKSRVFEPFFTTKSRGEGTGLGLPIVQSIVLHHGGRVAIDSTPGKGTVVTIELPCCDAPPVATGEIAAMARAGVVLLADPDRLIRRTLSSALEKEGYVVEQAADSDAAVAKFRERSGEFSVVLLNCELAKFDGAACHAAIRASGSAVPVVMLGACADCTTDPDRDFVLAKPFRMTDLLDLIGRVTSPDSDKLRGTQQ